MVVSDPDTQCERLTGLQPEDGRTLWGISQCCHLILNSEVGPLQRWGLCSGPSFRLELLRARRRTLWGRAFLARRWTLWGRAAFSAAISAREDFDDHSRKFLDLCDHLKDLFNGIHGAP